jgi:hypothetical protein
VPQISAPEENFLEKRFFCSPPSRNSTTGISVKFEVEADQENTRRPEPPSYLELASSPKRGLELFYLGGIEGLPVSLAVSRASARRLLINGTQ